MDYENLTPQYRIEEYLEAIVKGWAEATQYPYPDYPSWRIEEFLDAFITYIWEDGDHPRKPCPEPVWRLEECLRAIYDVMTGAATPWPFPLPTTNRIEEYLAAIHAYLADNTELPVPEPVWRIEQWLAYALDAVKQGGGIEKTVSGTMVHITDALAKAALSVLVSIEPIQSLHGYDHPWPAGGGKNKFDGTFLQGYWAFANGAWSNSPYWIATSKIPCKPSTYYTASSDAFTTRFQGFVFYDENDTYISTSNVSANQPVGYTAQTPANAAYLVFNIAGYPATTSPILPSDVTHFQIEEGQTATSFAPYSNICPITGRAGVSVTRTGKNLLDFENKSLPFNGNSSYTVLDFGEDKTFSELTLTFFMDGAQYSTSSAAICDYRKNDGTHQYRISTAFGLNHANVNTGAFSKKETNITFRKLVVYLGTNYGAYTAGTCSMQLELGSTATTYEPYNGNTYSVYWSTQAGTVYGGTVDVVTGVLTVTHAISTITETVNASPLYSKFTLGAFGILDTEKQSYCNILTPHIGIASTIGINQYLLLNSSGYNVAQVNIKLVKNQSSQSAMRDANNAILAQWAAEGHPLQIVWGLATPLTYQLTPQEVQMLLGENYVWSSSGDTVSVTCYAEGNANPLQSLNILLGGNYSNPKTADDVSDKEALDIILGGNK